MAMIECAECKAHISDTAKQCPQCGYRGRPDAVSQLATVIKWAIAAPFVLAIGMCAYQAGTPTDKISPAPVPLSKSAPALPVAAVENRETAEELLVGLKKGVDENNPGFARERNAMLQHWYPTSPQSSEAATLMAAYQTKIDEDDKKAEESRSDWVYVDGQDELTGKRSKQAFILSNDYFELDFPYSNKQKATLTVRQHPRYGLDVILGIERGQIPCSSYDGCTFEATFDGGAVQKFSAAGAADNSSETLFVSNDKRFLAALKKSRSVKIVLPIYQNGGIVHSFRTVGLDWK